MWEHDQSSPSYHDNKQLRIGRGFLCCAAVRVPEEALVGAAFVHPRRMQGRARATLLERKTRLVLAAAFGPAVLFDAARKTWCAS